MQIVSADKLMQGDCIMWLGKAREVTSVRRSLGNGWIVTFVNKLTANVSMVRRVKSTQNVIEAPSFTN